MSEKNVDPLGLEPTLSATEVYWPSLLPLGHTGSLKEGGEIYYNQLLTEDLEDAMQLVRDRVNANIGTELVKYRVCQSYNVSSSAYLQTFSVSEVDRNSFTRLGTWGTSFHNLMIEGGRWSRVSQDERLSTSGDLAQWYKRRASDQKVAGSSPSLGDFFHP